MWTRIRNKIYNIYACRVWHSRARRIGLDGLDCAWWKFQEGGLEGRPNPSPLVQNHPLLCVHIILFLSADTASTNSTCLPHAARFISGVPANHVSPITPLGLLKLCVSCSLVSMIILITCLVVFWVGLIEREVPPVLVVSVLYLLSGI